MGFSTSVKVVMLFVLAVIVILGLIGANEVIFGEADDEVNDGAKEQSNTLDCIMVNKEDALEECRDNSEDDGG